jgi:hypothetical protein
VNRDILIEQAAAAFRDSGPRGEPQGHRAFHDLDAAGRQAAFDAAYQLRQIEMALDPEGLSSTARAILARLGA